MNALYQRLRELDWDSFQRLAQQLLAERHPGLEIKHVEGSGGDKGLDLFAGTLTAGPTIWQCKHFPNGFKASQREQVKKSLDEATKNFNPNTWILVISIDLDAKGHEWFQKLKADYSAKTSIGLFQASDIVRELIYRRNIRDTFFPGAVLDTVAVRRSLDCLGTMDRRSLDELSGKSLDEQIARLEEADARFNYGISYAPNAGPDLQRLSPLNASHIASVTDGTKRTDIFVRDYEAVRLDPPKINFSLSRLGLEKLLEFQRTGKPQQLVQGEVSIPKSSFDFVLPDAPLKDWQMHILPSAKTAERVLSWRVTASNGTERIRYDLVKFRIVSVGTEEVELESISDLPFVLRLTFRIKSTAGGEFTFTHRFQRQKLSGVAKALRFKHLLLGGAGVQLHSLDQDLPVGTFGKGSGVASEIVGEDRVLLDMAEVASAFGWDVSFPEKIDEQDLEQLALLVSIVRGLPLPVNSLTGSLQKDSGTIAMIQELADSQLAVFACFESLASPLIFCGVEVTTGPILFRTLEARIKDIAGLLAQVENAAEGETVSVGFEAERIFGERAPNCDGKFYVAPADRLAEPPAIP